ncbi:MAG: MFS transporter [Pseudomonadota bacterium]
MTDHKWKSLSAITFVYVFLNISVFNTLGVVLAYMVESLDWSFTAAGFSYTVLGVACGLGSLLPIVSLKTFGARRTVAFGCVLLAAGFAISFFGQSIALFYVAMALIGGGFAMSGNIPAVWIIGAFFEDKSPRIIGLYMMAGACGAIIGPPLVQTIVATYGWRAHWVAMFALAIVCIAISYFAVEEPGKTKQGRASLSEGEAAEKGSDPYRDDEWPYMDALKTPAFAIVALAIALLLTAVTTISAVGVSHLTMLGSTARAASLSLGFFALIGTLSKGLSGPLCERFSSQKLLIFGAVMQGAGLVILASADSLALLLLWGLVFGSGWGLTYVACTVISLEYFGPETGARVFAAAHIFASVAAFGPLIAGSFADTYETFAPVFYICAALFLMSAGPMLLLKKPERNSQRVDLSVSSPNL